jgi:hypothetical protein
MQNLLSVAPYPFQQGSPDTNVDRKENAASFATRNVAERARQSPQFGKSSANQRNAPFRNALDMKEISEALSGGGNIVGSGGRTS